MSVMVCLKKNHKGAISHYCFEQRMILQIDR